MALHAWIRRLFLAGRPGHRSGVFGWKHVDRLECRTLLSAFVVTTPLDFPDATLGDGIAAAANGQASLRAAVQETNSLPGHDTIILPPGLFELFPETSPGTHSENSAQSQPLTIEDDLTLIGSGSVATQIDGGTLASVFDVRNGASLSLGWLAIRNTQQQSVAVTSGELIEIADVDRDAVLRVASDEESGEPPPDVSDTSLVSDLNSDRARAVTLHVTSRRQSELLALAFNTQAPPATALPLIIPAETRGPQSLPTLDATVGIRNPQLNESQTASRIDDSGTPRIARSRDGSRASEQTSSEQSHETVVNSLFETDSLEPENAVLPATAIDSAGNAPASDPTKKQDSPDLSEPQPLFPELGLPPVETELPDIPKAAPLLPDLEVELPEIRIDESAVTPRRSSLMPVALGAILAATLRFRSPRNGNSAVRDSRLDTKWATRVDALA